MSRDNAAQRKARKQRRVQLKAVARERRIKDVEKLIGKRWAGR